MSGQLHALTTLPAVKRLIGWAGSGADLDAVTETKFRAHAGNRTPVTILTELPRILQSNGSQSFYIYFAFLPILTAHFL
jgi:hypothetical protein